MSVQSNEEQFDWAQSIFDRLGLDLSEVINRTFLSTKQAGAALAVSMASMDKRLNLTDDERTKMGTFLKKIKDFHKYA